MRDIGIWPQVRKKLEYQFSAAPPKNSYESFVLSKSTFLYHIYMYFLLKVPKGLYQLWFNGKADLTEGDWSTEKGSPEIDT